jgi:hypothetical protein
MNIEPITHLIIDTSSSNEDYNGDCDFCLVPLMTPGYVSYLLAYMDEIRRLHRTDIDVYGIECWDASPAYFRFNDKMETLRDIDGNPAVEVPRGEPILLTAAPRFSEEDYQRVECRTVEISKDDVWWTAYVKHSNIRIETAHVEKKTFLRIQRSLGIEESHRPSDAKTVPPAIRKIHDLLYPDRKDGRKFYNPDKSWDADTIVAIARIVAEFIPHLKET